MESHFPLRQIQRIAPCKPHIESQEIDLELITDSSDAIQGNELVYVDELPDGSPHFVASHGLPTFEKDLSHDRKRPLVNRGSVECEDVKSHDFSVDFVLTSFLTWTISSLVPKECSENACL